MSMLEIKDLHAKIHNHEVLKGVDLAINAGEVHSIMGPNGSGKSTLAQVLARRETYEVTRGQVLLNGKDLLAMKPEEAACEGLFMAFQYPVEIPGISNAYFLRAAVNAIRKYRGEEELDAMDFLPLLKEKMRLLEMDERFLNRPVNEGFSGGEKKRNEIVQMAVLEPRMAILDETDSGLDIDALRIVAKGVNNSFLYAYMRHSGFATFIKEFANGANVLHLKPEVITQQKIIIPPRYTVASEFREDLKKAGKGDGKHAFNYPLAATLRDGQAHTISIRFVGSSTELVGSPKTLLFPKP